MNRFFIDQMGTNVSIKHPPKRIISLVPSQTELLFDLGLHEEVIGITKFCIHPNEWFKQKVRVGGTKKVNFERIKQLQPDLIIGNKEENTQSDIELLQKQYAVWMSDIYHLQDAYEMMLALGVIVDKPTIAQTLVTQIQREFTQLNPAPKWRVAYLIWQNPYMVAASHTFIDELLNLCGFQNVFAQQKRYPTVSIDALQAHQPQVVLLSSEPYPFKQKQLNEIQKMLPNAYIELVDGELFSWYGSRLLQSAKYFNLLINKLRLKLPFINTV